MNDVWVVIEQAGGAPTQGSFEALGLAQQLAAGSVTAVVCGPGGDAVATAVGQRGADRVLAIEAPELSAPTGERLAAAIIPLVRDRKPTLVLLAASAQGRDLAPRLAAALGVMVATDCVAVTREGEAIQYTRPMFAGKVLATCRLKGTPQLATLRPRVAAARPPEASKTAAVERVAPAWPSDLKTSTVTATPTRGTDKPELTEADIVVSGGRGLGAAEQYRLIEELAAVLGAANGASRAIVDLGWRPHEEQVGQTGKTVSPKLYVAVGISGAIQHRVGMQTSQCIVAINKDPNAPIFKIATYGLVGDLFTLVPLLIQELKRSAP